MPKDPDPQPQLSPDGLLSAEYTYIAQTAFQAHEDRARVITFYLVNLGGFVAALYSSQNPGTVQDEVLGLFGGLFLVLSITGMLTILQLIRLRQAWFDSVAAMSQIKEYYRARLPELKLEQAFLWRKSTAPAHYKPWSISFLLALQVALLSGVSLGASVYYFGLLARYVLWLGALIVGAVYVGVQMGLYARLLKEKR